MSYIKRQELFGQINPLLKKYKYDGEVPPSYVPPQKRSKISSYMGRSSFKNGFEDVPENVGLTVKQSSEAKNAALSDYHKSLSDRIKDGLQVKTFQNTQRIYLGHDKADRYKKSYKRAGSSKIQALSPYATKVEPYSDLVKRRNQIKENTNKVNCFVDGSQPEFINSMSRTMDAFDMRISTFGGKDSPAKNKRDMKDAGFAQDKRAFIRTSNGYENNDPFKITEQEYVQPIKGSGPAFEVNYDNKYKQNTAFANDQGRVKDQLNINTQNTKALLDDAERATPLVQLKDSSIKFQHPELGEPNHREGGQNKADFQSGQKLMKQRSNTSQGSHTPNAHKTSNSTIYNAKSYNLKGRREQPNSHEISPRTDMGMRTIKTDSVERVKPYELWKQYIVTSPDTVKLDQNRDIKLDYDQSSKAHLTMAAGGPNKVDYKSQNKIFHGKAHKVNLKHADLDSGVHKLMKKTNYQIGQGVENEVLSTVQTQYIPKQNEDIDVTKGDKNLRRAHPDNPNRIPTVGFGFGAEKGTSEHQVVHRDHGYYHHYYYKKQNEMHPKVAHTINKGRGEFNLSNKFEYGLDCEGGIEARQEPVEERHVQECLDKSAKGHQQREEYKEKIERQNFTIQHDKHVDNSETKQIGTHGGKGIANQIDIEDLKRSHLPTQTIGGKVTSTISSVASKDYRTSNLHSAQMKSEYHAFKTGSTKSNVPFAQNKRNRLENTYSKFDKVNGFGQSHSKTQYNWKIPTYDLKP